MEARVVLSFKEVGMSFEITYQLQVYTKGHLINCAGIGRVEIVDSCENPGLPGIAINVRMKKGIEAALLATHNNDPRTLMSTFGWRQVIYR